MELSKQFLSFTNEKTSTDWLFGQTDPGAIREFNEDSLLFMATKKLFIVADGMGGHNAGEVASQKAVETVNACLTVEILKQAEGDKDKTREALTNSIKDAHKEISQMADDNHELYGMGCTLIAGLVNGDFLHLGHVGDSRAYLVDETEIKLLTIDHSYVMELVQAGEMTMAESRQSVLQNQLSQAIGASDTVVPDYNCYSLKPGDKVLLCSDGLWDMLEDNEIYEIVKLKQPIEEICKILIDSANKAGGKDNISVVIYHHIENEKNQK